MTTAIIMAGITVEAITTDGGGADIADGEFRLRENLLNCGHQRIRQKHGPANAKAEPRARLAVRPCNAGNVCRNFGPVYIWGLVPLLFVANTINIAADLGAMGDA